MADRRWLEQRGPGWYAVLDVPRPLQAVLGRKRFIKSLGTREHRIAIVRRHLALAEFHRAILEAKAGAARSTPLVDSGLAWQRTFAALAASDPATVRSFGGRDVQVWDEGEVSAAADARETADLVFSDHLDRVRDEQGHAAATMMADLAMGRATPLLHFVDSWLAEGGPKGPLKERTRRQYRSDVEAFGVWLATAGVPATLQAVSKVVAGRYVTGLLGDGMERKTANRKVSAVSSYWRWTLKRGHAEGNPWTGQSLAKSGPGSDALGKRPFTTEEALKLLQGGADPEMADAMRIAALSGMRIEEVYRLTAADCAGDWFTLRQSKTRAGVRRVPIHSELVGIIAKRTEGQPKAVFLFPEAGPIRPGRERSMPVSKRFGHYRKRLGVDAAVEGRRQGQVDFHSWRRFFVTMARNAGIDRATVAAVVGHDSGNITDDLYSGGPSPELLRACVEAVKLPTAAPS